MFHSPLKLHGVPESVGHENRWRGLRELRGFSQIIGHDHISMVNSHAQIVASERYAWEYG